MTTSTTDIRREALAEQREQSERPRAENAALRGAIAALLAENARLRGQNRDLRAALDAHIARTSSSRLYGPVELSPGTCVGPHRDD